MTHNDTVGILMATYNGAKYIKEQLDSIICQTYENWILYISDDGSSDDTLSILYEYERKDNRIHVEQSLHRGACGNFAQLINKYGSLFNYLMFCDQDDVWKENKVKLSFENMKQRENELGNKPIMVFCRKKIVNSNLKEIDKENLDMRTDFHSILLQNPIYGCTMMLNKSAIEIATPIPLYATNHDHWIALKLSLCGNIYLINKELILYRQHNNNVTGGMNNYGVLNKIKKWNIVNEEIKKMLIMSYKFCKCNNENVVAQSYIKMIECKKNIILKMHNIHKYKIQLNNRLATVRIKYVLYFKMGNF